MFSCEYREVFKENLAVSEETKKYLFAEMHQKRQKIYQKQFK